jgi:peptide/nickel transport system substrate-binding protein
MKRIGTHHRLLAVAAPVGCALAIVVAISACSSSKGATSTKSISATLSGPVVIALPDEPTSVDPCDDSTNANARVLQGNIVQALTEVNPTNGVVQPLLATSWVQQDPTTWLFTLRKGVTFQDGSPLDATAAAFGINRALNPKLGCQVASQFKTQTTATVQDAQTVKVVTAAPDPILPLRLSYIDLPSPKTPADSKTTTPIGTGPFQFVSRVIGQEIDVKQYSGYWGKKPSVTSARYLWRSEDSVRAAMTKTGEADLALDLPSQDVTDGPTTKQYPDNEVFFLRPSQTKAPFNDVRVREAVQYAINKAQLTSTLMQRTGKPTGQIVTSLVNGYVKGYSGPAFSVSQAKALLAQAKAAGVAVNTPIQLVTEVDLFPGSDEVSQAIQQELQAVGFTVTLKSVEAAEWSNYLRNPAAQSEPANLLMITHDNVSGDASFSFPLYFSSTGHLSMLDDTTIDSLLTQAAAASGAARNTLYQQAASEIYGQQAAVTPVAELSGLMTLSNRVSYIPNGLTNLDLLLSDISITK